MWAQSYEIKKVKDRNRFWWDAGEGLEQVFFFCMILCCVFLSDPHPLTQT